MNRVEAMSLLNITSLNGVTVQDIKILRRRVLKTIHPDNMGDKFADMAAKVNMACDFLIKEIELGVSEQKIINDNVEQFRTGKNGYSVNKHIDVMEYVKECKNGNYSKYSKDTWSIVFNIQAGENRYKCSVPVRKDDTYNYTISLGYNVGDSIKITVGNKEQEVSLNGTCCRVMFNFDYILKLVLTIEKE